MASSSKILDDDSSDEENLDENSEDKDEEKKISNDADEEMKAPSNDILDDDSSDEEELIENSKHVDGKKKVLNDGNNKDEEIKDSAFKSKDSDTKLRRTIQEEDDDDESKDIDGTDEKIADVNDDSEKITNKDGTDEKTLEENKKKEREDDNDMESDDDKGEWEKKKDEDEDDVEFDDTGAEILGSKTRQKPKQKIVKRVKTMTVVESERPKSDISLHITKLPNLVGIQPDAFDKDTFSPAMEEKEYKGYVHNMIRWRYKRNDDGDFIRNPSTKKLERESNTRLVKWEDGSMTLHVGSEVFVCDEIKSSPPANMPEYPGLNGFMYLSQKATNQTEIDGIQEEEPGGTVLECMGTIASKITPRPSSLQSEAHKALTVAVRQKTMKRAKIAEFVTQEDPEKAKEERIRTNAALDKDNVARKRNYNTAARRRGRTPGMNMRYMDGYDSGDLGQIKRKNIEEYDYGSDEDDDDDDGFLNYKARADPKGRKEQKRREQQDDSEEEEFNAQESDDEEQVTHKNKISGKKRASLFDEEDDD